MTGSIEKVAAPREHSELQDKELSHEEKSGAFSSTDSDDELAQKVSLKTWFVVLVRRLSKINGKPELSANLLIQDFIMGLRPFFRAYTCHGCRWAWHFQRTGRHLWIRLVYRVVDHGHHHQLHNHWRKR
jgi:hypothetical protein